jgi:ribosomal protein S18 acetylase RimI-like enzyme
MIPKINVRNPTVREYNELRRLAGWPVLETSLVSHGLSHSIFSIVITDEHDAIIGMGRIVGDGAIYLHIQDVIVRPQLQRSGIGKLIMGELLKHIESLGGKNTNIGLMCSKGREAFYRQFGFIDRPNEKFGAGMIKIKQ